MKKYFLLFSLLFSLNFSVVAQTILGIDVYHGTGTITWSSVYASGKTFAFVKATQGICFTDPAFTTNMSNASIAGLKVGAYHFATPEDNSAIAEADYFLSVAGTYIGTGYLPPVLDVENPPTAGTTCSIGSTSFSSSYISTTLTPWVQTWINTVYTATGVTPIIYTTAYIAGYLGTSLTGYKLWIADPGTSPTTPPTPTSIAPWTTWAFKQYSDMGTLPPGISGIVDLDVFNGTITDFNLLLGIGGLPDLTVIAQSLSASSVAAGGVITAYCAEDNSGTAASSTNNVTYYLSHDTVLTPGTGGDIYLNSTSYPSLAAASNSLVYSTGLLIPITTPPGNYYIFFWADGGQVVPESVESNNFARLPITVTASATTHTITTSTTGSGTATGGGTYSYAATANLLATPAAGSTFINWTEGGSPVSISPSYSFAVTTNRSLTANFSSCTYTLGSTGVTIYSPAVTESFWVYTTSSCSWMATTSGCSWVTLTSATGTGNGMVTFDVTANTSTSPRSCTITVGGQTFTLTQNGYVPPCSTTPSTPTGITTGVTASNSLYVSWTGTYSGGTYWELERSTSPAGPFSLIADVPILPSYGGYLDSSLTGGVTYYYRVRLCCDGNCSGYSGVTSGIACTFHTAATDIVSSADTICQGDTIHFTVEGGNLGTGDIWTWKNAPCYTTTVLATGNSIAFAPLTSGYVVVRPEGSTCPQPSIICAIKYFTVRPLPPMTTISASGSTTFCYGNSVTLSGNDSGGIWSNTSTSSTVTLTASGDYFVTNSNFCGNSVSNHILVTVDDPIVTTFVYPSSTICAGDSIVLSAGGAITYAWTGGITNGVAFAPTAAATYTVTGTDTHGCMNTATQTISIAPLPNAGTITGSVNVCVAAAITLSDAITGGTWSASNINATVTGGSVTGVISGIDTISYSVANACGSATATKTITINPLSNAGTITGTVNVCVGSATILADTATGGTWSASNANAMVTGGVVTGLIAGKDTISYSITNACNTATVTKTITVNPMPTVGIITGSVNVCVGAGITLADTVTGGTWSSSNSHATAGGGLVSGIAAGIDTILYSVTNTCGTATATKAITVNPLPNAGTITGTVNVCVGAGITLADTTATGGTWSSVTGGIATVTGGMVTGVAAGADTIHYSVTNSCGTAIATKTITVNPLPNAGTITSTVSVVCVSAAITLADGTTGGTWSASNGNATVLGGSVSGMMAGVDTIFYSVTNICGTASVPKTITVNPLPAEGTIIGTPTACVSSTTALSDAAFGGVWSSSSVSIATVGSTGIVTGISVGIDTIIYTVMNTCGIVSATHTVTINPSPSPGIITGLDSICTGSTITLADAVTGGTWGTTNADAIVSGSGIVGALTAGTDTITYTVTNSCGMNAATKRVIINTLPSAGTITGSDSVCIGSTITLTDGVSGGTWNASNSNAIVSGSGIVGGLTAGTDNIIYSVTNTCGTGTATKTILINSCPTETNNIQGINTAIKVYPNPNDGTFSMSLLSDIDEQVQVTITDMVGQKVKAFTTVTNRVVDVKLNEAAGIYFLLAVTESGKYAVKVTVE